MAFADALRRRDWLAAHHMLAKSLRDDWQPADLEREFDEMTAYFSNSASWIEFGQAEGDRAMVAILGREDSGGINQEAVDVRVIVEDGRSLIDHIVWGRP